MKKKRKGLIGIVVGVVFIVAGPVGGLLVTVFTLNRSFDAAKSPGALPEHKARNLAEGISESMNATAFGVGVAVIGFIVLVTSLIYVVRANKKEAAGTR